MKKPALVFSRMLLGINLVIASPKMTPRAVTVTMAKDAPIKIAHGVLCFAVSDITASWVLSPNSAMNNNPNVVNKTFQFMDLLLFGLRNCSSNREVKIRYSLISCMRVSRSTIVPKEVGSSQAKFGEEETASSLSGNESLSFIVKSKPNASPSFGKKF